VHQPLRNRPPHVTVLALSYSYLSIYLSKHSVYLQNSATRVFVYLTLKYSAAANVPTLLFIANNSTHDAHSRTNVQVFPTDCHNLLCLSKAIISYWEYLTEAIVMKHCIVHLCSAHFGQNKVLITSFSRVRNIQVIFLKCWVTVL